MKTFNRDRIGSRIALAVALIGMLSACEDPTAGQPGAQSIGQQPPPSSIGRAPDQGIGTQGSSLPLRAGRTATRVELIPGSGEVLGAAGARSRAVEATTAGTISLNFADADVRDAAQSVLAELLQLGFTVDPAVQARITLQTAAPISRASVLPVFEAALRTAGVAMIERSGSYALVPMSEARRQAGAVARLPPDSARQVGYGMRAVPLRYASAEDMRALLEATAPQGSVIRADPARNVLVIAGAGSDLNAMLETIELFDVDWMTGMSFAMARLQYAQPRRMAQELERVFGVEARSRGPLRFVPLERLGSLVVIAARPQQLERVRSWIGRLDVADQGFDQQLFVYAVQNGRSADLASTLGRVLGVPVDRGTTQTASRGGQARQQFSDPNYRTSRAAGMSSGRSQTFEVPAGSGIAQQGGPSQVQAPQTDSPSDSPQTGDDVANAQPQIRVIADETNNAVLVLATPREYTMIEAALRRLDVVPMQVLIEAAIAEVTLTNDLRFGLQWFLRTGGSSFSLSDVTSGAVNAAFPGFGYALNLGSNIRVVLSALERVTTVNVVSSPQLMVLNNQTAVLQVGDQVPIATQSAVGVLVSGAPIVNSIQLQDTGVILRVTPRVNDSGLVLMDIAQEVSDAVPTTTSDLNSPTIRQRRIASSVAIRTGETIALGGLIRDDRRRGNSGILGLAALPVVGPLFGTRNDQRSRTELLVLITPRVVRGSEDARAVTEELRQRMQAAGPLDRLRQPNIQPETRQQRMRALFGDQR